MHSAVHWRKYGESTTIPFGLIDNNGTPDALIKSSWTPIAGDVKYSSIDSGGWASFANTTNLPTADSNSSPLWTITLTAAEMSHRQISIVVSDLLSITPINLTIVTFGHASAQYPFDLSSTTAAAGITVAPIQATVATSIMAETDIELYQTAESPSLIYTVVDSAGVPIDLSAATLSFKVFDRNGTTIFTRATGGTGITVGGSSSNLVTITYTATNTATAGAYKYSLWRTEGSDTLLATGDCIIKPIVK